MRCEQIMKKDVECATPRDSIESVAVKMRDQNVGFMPVCDEEMKVLGTLTDRDIAVRLVAQGKPASTPVEEIMTKDCVSCSPSDDLARAEELMAQNQKSRIMCTDEEGCLLGVISLSDIAQHQSGDSASRTLRQVSEREAKPQARAGM